jgi:hypothetical protein
MIGAAAARERWAGRLPEVRREDSRASVPRKVAPIAATTIFSVCTSTIRLTIMM